MAPVLSLLGTAQDGGFPHAGCACAACAAARREPRRARRVACVGLLGAGGRRLMVDATPDFPAQAEALAALGGAPDRLLPDALVLTHAHIGHYLGLALLGREAISSRGLPVYCTRSMAAFLRANRPWAHLEERGEVALHLLAPGAPLDFDGVRVDAFLTPHRGEDTDTLGLEFRGPRRRVVYCSDADYFPAALVARIRDADLALVDGTFYDRDELPHRDIAQVRHPFVRESVVHLAGARGRVLFTHLNHTNALLHPDPTRVPALPPGFGVAAEGDVHPL